MGKPPTKGAKVVTMIAGVAMLLFGVPSLLGGSWEKLAIYWGIGVIALIYGLRMKTEG